MTPPPYRKSLEINKGSLYQDALIKTYGKEKAKKILKGTSVSFTVQELKRIRDYKPGFAFNGRLITR